MKDFVISIIASLFVTLVFKIKYIDVIEISLRNQNQTEQHIQAVTNIYFFGSLLIVGALIYFMIFILKKMINHILK